MNHPALGLDAPAGASIPGAGEAGLSVILTVDLPDPAAAGPRTLAVLADAAGNDLLRVTLRRAGAEQGRRAWDEQRENHSRYADASGTTAVLEAEVAVAIRPPYRASQPSQIRVGAPLALLGAGRHEIVVRLRPGKLDLLADGRLLDEEWPSGGPAAAPAGLRLEHGSARVWRRALSDGELGCTPDYGGECGILPGHRLQYWTPAGHNRWAGDTMLFHDGERLHLLYLIDRRHHGSKGFCGAHQVAHFSSGDLRSWQSHPLAVGIDEPWEAIGTGSVVRHQGRWHFIYGLHSGRMMADAGAGADLPQPFSAIPGTPEGTTIAVSDDGIHFRKQPVLVHAAQNPSVFPDPAGGFIMFAGEGAYGLYRSDDLLHWHEADRFIVPHGPASPWRNTCECMCHLEWNGWHYVFGGFTGFWMSRDLAGPYWDQDEHPAAAASLAERYGPGALNPRPRGTVGRPRFDIYEGLSAPMAAAMPDGRRILAGWLLDTYGWAGCLVLRELLQEADGTLGQRWLPETTPRTGDALALRWSGDLASDRLTTAAGLPDEYLLEAELAPAPGAGPLSVLIGGSGLLVDGCELRLDPRRRIAQWGRPAGGRPAADLRGQMAEIAAMGPGNSPYDRPSPHIACKARDFAIDGVEGLDRPYRLRVLVVQDRKSGSVIIDAEIDGRRTLITRRQGLAAPRLQLMAHGGTVVCHGLRVLPVVDRAG